MKEKNQARAVLIVGAVMAVLLGLVSIHVPFGRDQGVAAYAAEVMARGGTLYRDFYHFNLPGIFFIYRLALALPLPRVEAVNLTHLVFLLLTYFAVYRAGKSLLPPPAAAVAAAIYAAFAVVMYTTYWNIAQKESLAALPLTVVLFLALEFDRGRAEAGRLGGGEMARLLLLGLMAGAAALFKPTLGIVLLLAAPLALRERRTPARAALVAGLPLAGFGLALVPLLAYLLKRGAMGDLLESAWRFGGFYGGQTYQGLGRALSDTLWELGRWLYGWRFLAALGAAGAAAFRGERRFRLVGLFFGLLLLQLVAQMKFFTYHFIPLLVPLALLAAAGGSLILGAAGGRVRRWMLVLILAALFCGNLGPDTRRYRREFLFDLGRVPRDNFLAPYGKWGGGDLCPAASAAVAAYLAAHTRPDEPVLVFGLEPGLYVNADRFPPTRFAYDQPLVTDPRGNQSFARYRETLRREFISDLAARPPAYIVVIENDATGIEAEDSYTQMREFKEFSDLVEREYVLETKIEDYFIFRRLDRSREGG